MVQLIITFDPATKQTQVQGPINDKMLAYSMLETARDAIKDHIDAQKSAIVEARGVSVLPLSNGNRG